MFCIPYHTFSLYLTTSVKLEQHHFNIHVFPAAPSLVRNAALVAWQCDLIQASFQPVIYSSGDEWICHKR